MPSFAKALEADLQRSSDMSLSLQFARLLNEARRLISVQSAECAECEGSGTIKHDVPDRPLKAGATCPDCLSIRDFLERCNQALGPVVVKRQGNT